MINLSSYESIGVFLEQTQTGTGAEINPFVFIDDGGKARGVFYFSIADSFAISICVCST